MPALLSFARRRAAVSIIWLGLLLGGCAGEVNIRPTLAPDTVVGANEGLIVARFVNAGNYPLPFNQLTINPQNLNESAQIKPERLVSARKHLDDSTVFASTVAAGAYSLSSVRAFHVFGEVYYSRFVGADVSFGTFDVRPGQITDLGTIVYYPKPQGDRYQDTLVRLPGTATGEVLERYFPFRDFDPETLLTWNDDGFDDERQAQYFSMLQNPVKFERYEEAPDGGLLFLAPLGVIVERAAGGEWQLDAVDTNLQLTSIAQNEAGDRIVGGSEGRLFHRTADGQWRDLSVDRALHVNEVDFVSPTEAVALVHADKKASVLRADLSADEVQWNEINSFQTTSGWRERTVADDDTEPKPGQKPPRPREISAAVVTSIGDEHLVTVYSIPSATNPLYASVKEHRFSYDPVTWVASPAKDSDGPTTVFDAGAVQIGVQQPGFWSWSSEPRYFVLDEASNEWRRVVTYIYRCGEKVVTTTRCGTKSFAPRADKSSFNLVAAPWFRNETDAIALASFVRNPFGDEENNARLLASKDGGQTWLDTGNQLPHAHCTNLIPALDDRLLLSCSGANGEFYESFDDGANWQLVREHQNF